MPEAEDAAERGRKFGEGAASLITLPSKGGVMGGVMGGVGAREGEEAEEEKARAAEEEDEEGEAKA